MISTKQCDILTGNVIVISMSRDKYKPPQRLNTIQEMMASLYTVTDGDVFDLASHDPTIVCNL